jgi:hypothetical protein
MIRTKISVGFTLGLVLFLNANGSQSLEPSKHNAEFPQKKENTEAQQTKSASPKTTAPPIIKPLGQHDNGKQQSYYDWFWPPDWSAWAQVFVGAWGLWVIWRTLKAVEVQAAAGRDNAAAALEQAKAITLAERAYVKMSHCPPGFHVAPDPHGLYTITLQVKNFGHTPATVTDLALVKRLLPESERLPEVPDYSPRAEGESPRIFLVREDEFFTTINFPISDQERSAIEERTLILHVYGYVDYVDKFGGHHRAGYARRFIPEEKDNLKIVIQRGYNYDCQRHQGDGHDWSDPHA